MTKAFFYYLLTGWRNTFYFGYPKSYLPVLCKFKEKKPTQLGTFIQNCAVFWFEEAGTVFYANTTTLAKDSKGIAKESLLKKATAVHYTVTHWKKVY